MKTHFIPLYIGVISLAVFHGSCLGDSMTLAKGMYDFLELQNYYYRKVQSIKACYYLKNQVFGHVYYKVVSSNASY